MLLRQRVGRKHARRSSGQRRYTGSYAARSSSCRWTRCHQCHLRAGNTNNRNIQLLTVGLNYKFGVVVVIEPKLRCLSTALRSGRAREQAESSPMCPSRTGVRQNRSGTFSSCHNSAPPRASRVNRRPMGGLPLMVRHARKFPLGPQRHLIVAP